METPKFKVSITAMMLQAAPVRSILGRHFTVSTVAVALVLDTSNNSTYGCAKAKTLRIVVVDALINS